MMFRNRLLICLLLFFAAACAPVELDTADMQTADLETATETMPGEDESHEDDHDEEEHHDEDAGEDEHHDEESGEHDDEHRELGAHEHGAAELTVALSGSDAIIELQTPAFNILGFEYAPTSDEEKTLLAESVATLETGTLLQINPDAECTLVSAVVEAEIAVDAHDDEAHDDEETHSDIDVSYTLECQQPDRIASLDASELFAQFPNFADIQVQWISDTQQSAADLTPDNPVLMFK